MCEVKGKLCLWCVDKGINVYIHYVGTIRPLFFTANEGGGTSDYFNPFYPVYFSSHFLGTDKNNANVQ
jgi:hypothetical protein